MTDPFHPITDGKSASEAAGAPVVRDHVMIRTIGRGSGGEVWLAQNALGAYRAIKVVYRQSFRHRRPFEREFNGVFKFEPVSRLHDGLVDVLQVGINEQTGYFYYVMELADHADGGQSILPEDYLPRTLAQDLQVHKRLPIAECLRIGVAVASGLGFLHRHELIHRDVKPSNIIFVNDVPKLADVGLVADVSEAKSYVGTEGFIPPEGPGTVQADIYSLGKVLYEISTGQDRQDYPELPPNLSNSAGDRDLLKFNKIVLKACRSDPRQRYKSADEMMGDLRVFQFSDYDPQKEMTRRRLTNIVGLVGACVALCVFTFLIRRLIWLLAHGQ